MEFGAGKAARTRQFTTPSAADGGFMEGLGGRPMFGIGLPLGEKLCEDDRLGRRVLPGSPLSVHRKPR